MDLDRGERRMSMLALGFDLRGESSLLAEMYCWVQLSLINLFSPGQIGTQEPS